MLRDECIDVVPTWAVETTSHSYREIDRELRSIAKRRAGLDVEEARWLREAEKLRIWRRLGFSTALEYLEDVFGYSPRTAMERLRVARELGQLRGLEAELRAGRLPYSAAKELSRVMTPATEAAWLERSRGKNLRDIEELVAGRKKGDAPEAPQDPALLTRKLVLELPSRVDALLQQCRGVAEDEKRSHIDDVDLLELLCRRFLEAPTANEKRKRPAHRIVIHTCDECGRGWQEARRRRVLLGANDLARAQCDAEVIDDRKRAEVIDDRKRAEVIDDLEKAKQALVGLGYTRRAARQAVLDAWPDTSGADVATLVRAVLARASTTEPIADDPCKLAKQALVKLGYPAAIAARAVTAASAHVGVTDLQTLIKKALQRCN